MASEPSPDGHSESRSLRHRPLGLLSHPRASADNLACRAWVKGLTADGVRVVVAEVRDYELRRELLRARSTRGVRVLDEFLDAVDYLPLTTDMMRQAAALWAQARQAGRPTADPHALDGDVILAAQALSLGYAPDEIIVATTNVGHVPQFVTARRWQDIWPHVSRRHNAKGPGQGPSRLHEQGLDLLIHRPNVRLTPRLQRAE